MIHSPLKLYSCTGIYFFIRAKYIDGFNSQPVLLYFILFGRDTHARPDYNLSPAVSLGFIIVEQRRGPNKGRGFHLFKYFCLSNLLFACNCSNLIQLIKFKFHSLSLIKFHSLHATVEFNISDLFKIF